MNRSGTTTSRRESALDAYQTAATTIGEIRRDMAIFALTRGQFSMIDAVLHCLESVGTAAVSIWTWTVADYEIDTFAALCSHGRVSAGRLIIDGRARKHCPDAVAAWQRAFGSKSVRYARNHAKIATVEGGGFRLLLRGSMNLNYNPRFEQFDLTEGCAGFDLVREIEAELAVADDVTDLTTIREQGGVGELFPVMEGLRPWTPTRS